MPSRILVIQPGGVSLERALHEAIDTFPVESLGVAVAYVSIYGTDYLRRLVQATTLRNVKLITDIRDRVTHPQALRMAMGERWQVRVVSEAQGTFHPKMYVGGGVFRRNGTLERPQMLVVGSCNLSNGGLNNNIECCLLRTSDHQIPGASQAFRRLWSFGTDLDDVLLEQYEEQFAAQNRIRSPHDLQVLGVSDTIDNRVGPPRVADVPMRNDQRTITTRVATTAWVGLQSFTGEYRFQIEFPRSAGEVLGQIIRQLGRTENIDVLCNDDVVRQMRFRYYEDNSMFRLNVPNDVPGVARARQERTGIAVVEMVQDREIPINFGILHEQEEIDEIMKRSFAMGTLERTQTRLYGWY